MIPARIATSAKKVYELADGEYFGVWQDRFVWLNDRDDKTKIVYRFDTNVKAKAREKVRVIVRCPYAYVYEILKQK